jgi:RNA polymerase sigma-70 factor, ECF subfamily
VTESDEDALDLIARARNHDAAAWEALYERVYPRLIAFSARRVGRDRASEMVAETMARAVASIQQLNIASGGFDPWLFGICRNVIGDHYRRESREQRHVEPVPVGPGEMGEGVERHEEAAAVVTAFSRLSDDDRELLDLRVIAGLSVNDVAATLGKQNGAIRMAQSRALERLRTHFKEVYQ